MNYCNALYPLITVYNALYIKALSKQLKILFNFMVRYCGSEWGQFFEDLRPEMWFLLFYENTLINLLKVLFELWNCFHNCEF